MDRSLTVPTICCPSPSVLSLSPSPVNIRMTVDSRNKLFIVYWDYKVLGQGKLINIKILKTQRKERRRQRFSERRRKDDEEEVNCVPVQVQFSVQNLIWFQFNDVKLMNYPSKSSKSSCLVAWISPYYILCHTLAK